MSPIDKLKVFNANIAGDKSPPVGDIIKQHSPDLLVLTEAYHAHQHLKKVGDNRGYLVRQYGKDYGAEAPSIAIMLSGSIDLLNRDIMRMDEPWWFNGKKRQPRRYVRLHIPGWRICVVHFPPGGPSGGGSKTGGKNGPAWKESRDRIKKRMTDWFDAAPDDAHITVGDFNGTHDEVSHHIADPIGAHMTSYGKVDHVVRHRAKAANKTKMTDPSGKGHGWGIVKLDRK